MDPKATLSVGAVRRAGHPLRAGALASLLLLLLVACDGGGSAGPAGGGGRGGSTAAGGRPGTGGGGATGSGGTVPAGSGGAGGGAGAAPAGGATVVGSGGTSGAGGMPLAGCEPSLVPPAPLRWLDRQQYNSTVRDLFGDTSNPGDRLPLGSADFSSARDAVSPLLIEAYHTVAHDLAMKWTADDVSLKAVTGCDLSAAASAAACRESFLNGIITRMFRHPVNSDDLADLGAVFDSGVQLGGNQASGARAVLEVALQSPEFLYRIELGEPLDASRDRLTSYEMATRLSYLLWGSTPDAPLLAAAAAGQLQTKDQIAAQARKMLTDGRARDMVRLFYVRLLGLEQATLPTDVRPTTPDFTPEIGKLMFEELGLFVDDVTWSGAADFQNLLTSPFSWLNGPLAAFQGVSGVTGAQFQRVELGPVKRAGILTQPAFLASHGRGAESNPVSRGVSVFRDFLCGTVEPPPPDAPPMPPVDLPANATTRQRLAAHSADPSCARCHQDIDPLGFAFEHYDGTGRWRDSEKGQAINATGTLLTTDARGTFDGVVELAGRLVASQDARRCYVRNWLAFANGRPETPADSCSRQALEQAFARAHGNVPELLIALTQTDAFLYRPRSELRP